jgi:hypothetical protein
VDSLCGLSLSHTHTHTHTHAHIPPSLWQVTWRADLNTWQPTGIHHRLLCESSILPDQEQLRAFESSDLFRDMAYMDVNLYRQKVRRGGGGGEEEGKGKGEWRMEGRGRE